MVVDVEMVVYLIVVDRSIRGKWWGVSRVTYEWFLCEIGLARCDFEPGACGEGGGACAEHFIINPQRQYASYGWLTE